MAKRRFSEANWRKDPWFRALCTAFLSCRSEQSVGDFLRDVGTLSELQSLSERLEVAKQLSLGQSYRVVSELTGASTATVARVAAFLRNGTGGYRNVLGTANHRAPRSSWKRLVVAS